MHTPISLLSRYVSSHLLSKPLSNYYYLLTQMEMTRLQCYFGFLFSKSYQHLVEKLNGQTFPPCTQHASCKLSASMTQEIASAYICRSHARHCSKCCVLHYMGEETEAWRG